MVSVTVPTIPAKSGLINSLVDVGLDMLSVTTWVANGAKTDFKILQTYLVRGHLTVKLGPLDQTGPGFGGSNTWDFVDDITIRFATAPAKDTVVKITRTTPTTDLISEDDLVDWSPISAKALDDSFRQILYYNEETKDRL